MKIVPDSKCPYVVIVGAWNPKIFTPFWLRSQGITESEEVELELTFGAADYKFLMKFDGIILSISDTHLVLRLTEWEQQKLSSLEKVALKILDQLRHTPLKAIGTNFDFEVEDPVAGVLDLFKIPSQLPLSNLEYTTSALHISHTFAVPDVADVVTLQLDDTDKGYKARVNFNKLTGSAEEAMGWLTDKIIKFHECAMNILEAYHLKPNENDNE